MPETVQGVLFHLRALISKRRLSLTPLKQGEDILQQFIVQENSRS